MNETYERIAELMLEAGKKQAGKKQSGITVTYKKHPRTGKRIKVETNYKYPEGHPLRTRTFGRHSDRDEFTGEDYSVVI